MFYSRAEPFVSPFLSLNHSHVSFMLEHTLSVEDYSSSILAIPSHKAVSQASTSSQDQNDH